MSAAKPLSQFHVLLDLRPAVADRAGRFPADLDRGEATVHGGEIAHAADIRVTPESGHSSA